MFRLPDLTQMRLVLAITVPGSLFYSISLLSGQDALPRPNVEARALPDPEIQQPIDKSNDAVRPPGDAVGAPKQVRLPGQTGHGVMLTIRGRVRVDGPIPVVPPLKIQPDLRLVIPRDDDERKANEQRLKEAAVVEVPDDSLVIDKDGGIANVVIYMKQPPPNWKPSEAEKEPVELRVVDRRFQPHTSFARVGQPIRFLADTNESVYVRSRKKGINFIIAADSKWDIVAGFAAKDVEGFATKEMIPISVTSNLHPWMSAWMLVLDHPFAAITDSEGRFEIRDLPTGEHHFQVWHERRGFLNKNLVVRVEDDKVTDVELKFAAEQLAWRKAATPANGDRKEPKPSPEELARRRETRLNANDREAATKLVGRWMVTLPAGHISEAQSTLTDDGCLKFSSKQGNLFLGTFAVRGDRLELIKPAGAGVIDLVWQAQSNNLLTLIVDRNEVGANYRGAKLERVVAAADVKDGGQATGPVFRIPDDAVQWVRELAAAHRAARGGLKSRRPAGIGDLESPEAIQRAVGRGLEGIANSTPAEGAMENLRYLGDAAFDGLVSGSTADNPQLAKWCCVLLRHQGKKAVQPLCAVLDSQAESFVRAAAAESLGQTFEADGVSSLIAALDDKEVRVSAMNALMYVRDSRAIEPLQKLEEIPGIGHAATQAIQHIRSPQGYAICEPENRDLWQLCEDAHTLKGERFQADELNKLSRGVNSGNWWISYRSLFALGALDARDSVPAIMAAPLSLMKFHVLAQIGTDEAVDYIIDRLHSLNPQTRELALDGLRDGADRWAAPLLVALLDDASLGVPERKDEDDPTGTRSGLRSPLKNWPKWHKAHSALYSFLGRFGLKGEMRNLYLGESNDVSDEVARLKKWWPQHGGDFVVGKPVPNPGLTSVWYLDP